MWSVTWLIIHLLRDPSYENFFFKKKKCVSSKFVFCFDGDDCQVSKKNKTKKNLYQ